MISIPVVVNEKEVIVYEMQMSEKMPMFNYWGRGREIIHRLIMRAAMTDKLSDFNLELTDERAISSIIV